MGGLLGVRLVTNASGIARTMSRTVVKLCAINDLAILYPLAVSTEVDARVSVFGDSL